MLQNFEGLGVSYYFVCMAKGLCCVRFISGCTQMSRLQTQRTSRDSSPCEHTSSVLFVQVVDARDMAEFEAEYFDAVIDKGMTDSIMYNDKFALMMAKVSIHPLYPGKLLQ